MLKNIELILQVVFIKILINKKQPRGDISIILAGLNVLTIALFWLHN